MVKTVFADACYFQLVADRLHLFPRDVALWGDERIDV